LASAGETNLTADPHAIIVDAGAGSRECNTFSFSPIIEPIVAAGEPPKPQGGALANGVYYLSKREVFLGLDAGSHARPHAALGALIISGSNGVSAEGQISWMEVRGELPLPTSLNVAITVTEASFDYTVTCGGGLAFATSGSIPFTATASELLWIHPDPSGTLVDTFQRQ